MLPQVSQSLLARKRMGAESGRQGRFTRLPTIGAQSIGLARWPAWSRSRRRGYGTTLRNVREAFGVEVARCVLGHADVRTTELYSSLDMNKAVAAAAQLG